MYTLHRHSPKPLWDIFTIISLDDRFFRTFFRCISFPRSSSLVSGSYPEALWTAMRHLYFSKSFLLWWMKSQHWRNKKFSIWEKEFSPVSFVHYLYVYLHGVWWCCLSSEDIFIWKMMLEAKTLFFLSALTSFLESTYLNGWLADLRLALGLETHARRKIWAGATLSCYMSPHFNTLQTQEVPIGTRCFKTKCAQLM